MRAAAPAAPPASEAEPAEPTPPKPVAPARHRATTCASTTRTAAAEEDARRKVIERVRTHDLAMKVSDTEWQWDRNKLTIYFTAEKRVDFRALVRDLASLFRTRIELRQIGVRDEAARLSGVGRCGREYCCSSWLTELSPGQSRPGQGSAPLAQPVPDLGRLRPAALLPQVRARVLRHGPPALSQGGEDRRRPRGAPRRVVAVDIFRERVFLRSEEHGSRIIPLVQLREEVEALGEVLMTAEARGRSAVVIEPAPAAEEALALEADEPAADVARPAMPGTPPPHRRRRRRHRRGPGNDPPPPA